MNEICALLEKSQQGRLDNCLRLEDVRQWLASYLELHGEETQRFPLEMGRPHWDLLLADGNHDIDGMYILAFFCGEDVTFLAGQGSISDIRNFAESEFPDDPEEVVEAAMCQFRVAGSAVVPLIDVCRWAMPSE